MAAIFREMFCSEKNQGHGENWVWEMYDGDWYVCEVTGLPLQPLLSSDVHPSTSTVVNPSTCSTAHSPSCPSLTLLWYDCFLAFCFCRGWWSCSFITIVLLKIFRFLSGCKLRFDNRNVCSPTISYLTPGYHAELLFISQCCFSRTEPFDAFDFSLGINGIVQ